MLLDDAVGKICVKALSKASAALSNQTVRARERQREEEKQEATGCSWW